MKKNENILASSGDTDSLVFHDTNSDAQSGSLVDLKTSEPIRPFKIKFDEAELNDLRQRIRDLVRHRLRVSPRGKH